MGVALKWGSQLPSRCRARWFSPSGGSSQHGSSRGTEGARRARLAPRTSAPSCAGQRRPCGRRSLPRPARVPQCSAGAAQPCRHTAVRCGGGRAEPQSKQNSRRASKQTNKRRTQQTKPPRERRNTEYERTEVAPRRERHRANANTHKPAGKQTDNGTETNKQAIQQTGEQNKHTHKQNKQSKTK